MVQYAEKSWSSLVHSCQLLVKPHSMLAVSRVHSAGGYGTGRYSICFSTNAVLYFNPLNAELNPTCHLLALLGAHHIFHVSGLRVKGLSLKNGGRWNNVVTIFGCSKVKSIKIAHIFYREETDADRCNLLC